MATIDLCRKHSLARDEVRKRAEDLARDMEAKLGIKWRWEATRSGSTPRRAPRKGSRARCR